MSKFTKIFSVALAVCALCVSSSMANEEHKVQPEFKHFEVETPKSAADSWKMLDEKIAEVDKLVKDKNFEAVHEKSYSLMAAVEGLQQHNTKIADEKKAKEADERLSKLAEEAFEVHESAENSRELELNKSYAEFKKTAAEVKKLTASN